MKKVTGQKDRNILIIDSVISNLVQLSKIVTELGYRARPVISVPQAKAAIDTYRPSMILLDISIPEESGLEFCRKLRQIPKFSQIPVIFISAYDSIEYKLKAFELDAVDYIVRPFDEEEVSARIKNHMQTEDKLIKLANQNKRLRTMLNTKTEMKKEDKLKVIQSMILIMKMQEMYPHHMDRVAHNAKVIASGLQLSSKYADEVDESFIEVIEAVAPIHDLGMLSIDSRIVKKPGRLTSEEMSVIKQHTSYGVQPLSQLYKQDQDNEYLRMALDVAMYHHERYDGLGYPYGIVKKKIPLAARIVSLVSIYDVLISNTYYRKAYSKEESINIINQESGKMFDPDLVQIFNMVKDQLIPK